MTCHLPIPFFLDLLSDHPHWSIIAAVTFIAIAIFIKRKQDQKKHIQQVTLDWILHNYTIEEGILYTYRPDRWLSPEVRDTLPGRLTLFEQLDQLYRSTEENTEEDPTI